MFRWRVREITRGRFCLSDVCKEVKAAIGVSNSWSGWGENRVVTGRVGKRRFRIRVGSCGVVVVDRIRMSNNCGVAEEWMLSRRERQKESRKKPEVSKVCV